MKLILIALVAVALFVIRATGGKIPFRGFDDDEPSGSMPADVPEDDGAPPAPYTPLPKAMRDKAKALPPLTSPARARYELMRTLRRQQTLRPERRPLPPPVAARRIPEPPPKPQASLSPLKGSLPRTIERNRAILAERAALATERIEAEKADQARRARAVAPAAPKSPILEEDITGSGITCAQLRETLDAAARMRRLFLLRELIEPPLCLRAEDPFLTFPYER